MKRKNINVKSYFKKLVFWAFISLVNITTPVSAAPNYYSYSSINYEKYQKLEELQEAEQSEKIEAFLRETVPGLPVSYRDVIDALIAEGHHVYIKGGVIRDLLSLTPSPPNDLDFDYTGTVEDLKRILDRNNWMYTRRPEGSLIIIGDFRSTSIDAMPTRVDAQTDEDSMEFTINNIFYHCNTKSFLRRSEEGLLDLKFDRLVIAATDWRKWLGIEKGRCYKVFRFWKMVGKGYVFSDKLADFFHKETSTVARIHPEGFRKELSSYLKGHYHSFDDLYRGSIAIMGYDWAQQHVLSLEGTIPQLVREGEEVKDQDTFNR